MSAIKQQVTTYTKNLAASGSPELISVGAANYLYISSAPVPFQFSLDGNTWNAGYQGLQLGPFATATVISLQSTTGTTASLTVYVSNFPIAYYPSTAAAPTFALGNFGLTASGNYNGQTLTLQAATIKQPPGILLGTGINNALKVAGVYNNKIRKGIVFSNPAGGTALNIYVADANGAGAITLTPGVSIYLETSSPFQVYCPSAGAIVNVTEIYNVN